MKPINRDLCSDAWVMPQGGTLGAQDAKGVKYLFRAYLLNLSSWCLVMVERLFLAVPRGCLQFVIVVFPDNTHLLF